MDDERTPDVPASGRRGMLRVFLMVAGGLAAPALALAAFFLSNSGNPAGPARPPAVQAGTVQGGAVRGAADPARSSTGASSGAFSPATTSTTAAPPSPAGPPPRDPFAPLVTQAPAGGGPGH